MCQKICSNLKMDDLVQELSLRSFKQMQKYSNKSQGLVRAAGLWKVSGVLKNDSSVNRNQNVT